MIPGELFVDDGEIELNAGRERVTLEVANTGDRPIQVGSHYHFFETNEALRVRSRRARAASASTSPPAPRCASSRARRAPCSSSRSPAIASCYGFNGAVHRRPAASALTMATAAILARGALRRDVRADDRRPRAARRHRARRSRSSATSPIYGEEVKFGGGKVIRDGMGQSQRTSRDAVDTVITNALILDHWGIVKADIGIKDGRIAGIGKAGNPDIQPGVDDRHRPGHRGDRGRGHDRHRRRHRHAHPLHLPAADRRGARVGHHDDDRRRHRSGDRHVGDDLHAGPVAHRAHAAGARRVPDELRLRSARATRACPTRCASRSTPARSASSCTRTGARRPRRSTAACRSPTRPTRRSRSTPTR